jgi:hypothetical protein
VAETLLAGYSASDWGGDCAADGSITLALAQDAVCTITNDDVSPTLTVIKTVINDNGGTALPSDFNLTIDGNGVLSGVINDVDAGPHTVAETLLAGYSASDWGGDCAADGSITLALAQDAVCTITNDDIPPSLTLVKAVNNGANPGGTATEADFTLIATGPTGFSGAGPVVNNGPSFDAGSYDLSETGLVGYLASDWVCVGDGTQVDGDTITLGLGDSATCTITNTAVAHAQVNKTSNGVPAAGFTFEIREGASTTSEGIVLAAGTTDTNGFLDFGGFELVPGNTYQLCETGMMPGWSNTLDGFTPLGATPEGSDNSTECVNFTPGVGETVVFFVNNVPPPGGDARTIGFWKNWTSCDGNGNQDPVLDETLVAAGGSILVGSLEVSTCEVAVDLLDKRDIGAPALVGDGKKMAGDAAYGLAAQLVAAKLNIVAGAGVCPAAADAISAADGLLASINFDGTGNYLKGRRNADLREQANTLAGILDAYNNNMFCH